jgi:hypothetical protein
MVAWYLQLAIATPLALLAVYIGDPWPDVLLVYVTAISVWAGIESAHARLNADLPSDDAH